MKLLEKMIKDERGWISKKPLNESVVFMSSGGLDSTIGIAQLIDKYNCVVYPLFVKRKSKNMVFEEQAFSEIIKDLQKKYPNNIRRVETLDVEVPPIQFKEGLTEFRLKNLGHALRNVNLQTLGVQYAVYLNDNLNIQIRSIFAGTVKSDAYPHNQLEAFRLMTLMTCWDQGDFSWQVTSPFLDPYFQEIPEDKSGNIKWAMENGLPINKTRTCTLADLKPCGLCDDCTIRRTNFSTAGYDDPAFI